MQRRILLLAHRVPVTGEFSLNDLAGAGGRMDEVARVVSTAFTVSNGLRKDTELTILFVSAPPPGSRRIRLEGARLRYLNPDERSTAALLKNALVQSRTLAREFEASPGLFIGPVDPEGALAEFADVPGTVWLAESGPPYDPGMGTALSAGAVVSDADDPTAREAEILRARGIPRASLGPVSLRASQCVDILHNRWDLQGAGPDRPPVPAPPPAPPTE